MQLDSVPFIELLRASEDRGSSLNESARDAVRRVALLTAALLQREVQASASTNSSRACQRWFAESPKASAHIGMAESDLAGLAEVFLGAKATKPPRDTSALERRIVSEQLAVLIGPVLEIVGAELTLGGRLIEVSESLQKGSETWERLTVALTIDGVDYDLVIAYRAAARQGDNPTARASAALQQIERMPVDVEVSLRHVKISFVDLARLKVGEVIRCDHDENEPLLAWVADRRVFSGRITHSDDGYLFEIAETYIEEAA